MDALLAWLQGHEQAVWWLGAVSLVTFFGSLAAIPVLVARIPPDYFVNERRSYIAARVPHPLIHVVLVAGKNLLGTVLVAAGVVMLVLPGQGLLTILVGLMLLDFPGKFAMERRLIRIPAVAASVNWMRAKAGRSPLAHEAPGTCRPDTQPPAGRPRA